MSVAKGPSRTAVMSAVGRAMHREGPPPVVLDDALAMTLSGEGAAAMAERLRHDMPGDALMAFARWVAVRARFTEDIVAAAVEEGVGQLAILGAGLDSFAFRQGGLRERLRVFEVDHPSSQEWKRLRLAAAGIPEPENLIFAPVDFEVQTLDDGLKAAGFDFSAPAVFTWIGVTMYLTLPAIESTLRTVGQCPPGSKVVFTYNLPPSALDTRAAALTDAVRALATDLGEPFISLFTPDEAEELVRRCGLDNDDHFGPAEAARRYFSELHDPWIGGPQGMIVASVPVP